MLTCTVKRIALAAALLTVTTYAVLTGWWFSRIEAVAAVERPVNALAKFDLSKSIIPTNEIRRGGPPPDGISSIDAPQFVAVNDVDFLQENDDVIVFSEGGATRIYPFRILVWHEIVNDRIEDRSIAVTYCPLCGTAMVFDRTLENSVLEFGVSGLLYNSDVLLYDRETESLWTQLGRKAVSGKHVGKKLSWLASEQMTWSAAKEKFKNAEVLSLETGYERNYDSIAYESYKKSATNLFPVEFVRDELERKEWILGVEINGQAKAYPINQLKDTNQINELPAGKHINDIVGETDDAFGIHIFLIGLL